MDDEARPLQECTLEGDNCALEWKHSNRNTLNDISKVDFILSTMADVL